MQLTTNTGSIDLEVKNSTPVVVSADNRVQLISDDQISSIQEQHDINVISLLVAIGMFFVLGGCSQLYKYEANICYLFMTVVAISVPFIAMSTHKTKKILKSLKNLKVVA